MNKGKLYIMNIKQLDREKTINLITAIIVIGFSISVFYHYILGAYFGLGYPYNTFLFTPLDRFNDFCNLYRANINLDPYPNPLAPYYPFLNLLIYLLTFFPIEFSFVLYSMFVIIFFICLNAVYLKTDESYLYITRIFIFSFLTYGFLFTIDRGNTDGLLAIFLMLFIFFYERNKTLVSSLFLAFAIASKVFPAVFLILLLSDKKHKEVLLTIAIVILLTIGSLLLFQSNFYDNLIFLLKGHNMSNNPYYQIYLGNNNLIQRGVSLFTIFKIIFIEMGLIKTINMTKFLSYYSVCVIILFFILATYIIFIEKEFWKKTTLLVFSMLLFTQISADYKLIFVCLPMLLFLNSNKEQISLYAIAFGLLLIPKDYYYLPNIVSDSGAKDISIAVLLNPLIMIAMMCMIIISGLKSNKERINIADTSCGLHR